MNFLIKLDLRALNDIQNTIDYYDEKQIGLGKISQKEAVAVNSLGHIFVADERHKVLGGGNLYRVKIPKK